MNAIKLAAMCALTLGAAVLAGAAVAVDPMTREEAQDYLARHRMGRDAENVIAAVMRGDAAAAEALLAAGVDPNAKGSLPHSALQMASLSCQGGQVSDERILGVMDALIRHGARVNEPGVGGLDALFVAVQNCKPAIVRRLVAAGANLNSRTPQGYTPLSMALIVKNYDAAEMLIEAGARLSAEAAKKLLDGEEKNSRLTQLVKRARAK